MSILQKFILLSAVLGLFTNCKYYQYNPDIGLERWKVDEFTSEDWRRIDEGYYYVLHVGNDTLEFYDMEYDRQYEVLTGHVRDFEGMAYEFYRSAVNSERKNVKRAFAGESGPATNQIHFFLDDMKQLESEVVSFSLKNIKRVDFVEQSGWNYVIGIGVALAIGAASSFGMGLLFIAAQYDE